MARRRSVRTRRLVTLIAFYGALLLLLAVLVERVLEPTPSQLSAYDNDWNDLGTFRDDLHERGIETRSLVSSPLLLPDVDHPSATVFVIAGVERDTYSLPRFGDPEAGTLVSFAEIKGYTQTEQNAILGFVDAGGTLIVLDDFGFASSLGSELGLTYSHHRLYDEAYAAELDANYTWLNVTEKFDETAGLVGHERWHTDHPCSLASDGTSVTRAAAGLCAHHYNDTSGRIEYDAAYHLLLSTPSAFEAVEFTSRYPYLNEVGLSSQESYLDVNDDGQILLEQESIDAEPDVQGPFTTYVEVCASSLCADPTAGRVFLITDGNLLMNAIYDPAGANAGLYDDVDRTGTINVPANDNAKWVMDVIVEALVDPDGADPLQPKEHAQVIFDESRHQQDVPAGLGDAYNFIYYMLVYFTSDGTAMLFLFLGLFVTLEAVMLKKSDPEEWRHVFSIIYYGFGDANRYGYYQRGNKVKQVFLSRVRNVNGLSREEFDSLPARELQGMISDPVLVKFVFEDRDYSTEQLVAVVKRIKAWGRK